MTDVLQPLINFLKDIGRNDLADYAENEGNKNYDNESNTVAGNRG